MAHAGKGDQVGPAAAASRGGCGCGWRRSGAENAAAGTGSAVRRPSRRVSEAQRQETNVWRDTEPAAPTHQPRELRRGPERGSSVPVIRHLGPELSQPLKKL